MIECPFCPATTPTWAALHAHFAQVHVGDPQSAHRADPLGRNGIAQRVPVDDGAVHRASNGTIGSTTKDGPRSLRTNLGPRPTEAAKPHGRTCIT